MKYETIIILNSMLDSAVIEKEIEKISEIINSQAQIIDMEKWGKRKLAYSINKKNYGFYVLFKFEGKGDIIQKFEKDFRINENILRFLTVRV